MNEQEKTFLITAAYGMMGSSGIIDIGRSKPLPGTPGKIRTTPKVGRNEPCNCGSGAKYKNCCLKNSGK